jgi:glycosyltransferase involved in cell wall biosynthesis
MWRSKSVSVVLPTYNEKDSIAGVIRGFEALGVVDEIVVVNNNAAPGTSEEVAGTSAREVAETTQGYGAAIRRGLREATGDLIAVCEPDGTFDPDDLFKLLTYTKESDFVVGSRTVSTFIWDGANMGWFLQFGNWTVAKMIEVSFNTTSLSDVGCTFRVVTRAGRGDGTRVHAYRLRVRPGDVAAGHPPARPGGADPRQLPAPNRGVRGDR